MINKLKICTKCGNSYLPSLEFFHKDSHKKDKLSSACKNCLILLKREYWARKKDEINAKRRTEEYKAKIDRKKRSIANKKYCASEKGKLRFQNYRQSNREKINESNLKYFSKIDNRLRRNIRSRIKKILANTNVTYKTKAPQIVTKAMNYSANELKSRIECQFKPGMSWDNYGVHGWHIDHKKPLSFFDLTNEVECRNACLLCNIQPLWAHENLTKNNKYIG